MAKKVIFYLVAVVFLFFGCSKIQAADVNTDAIIKFVNGKYSLKLKQLDQIDPAYLFVYANELFKQGQKDDAIFWYYLAQYRGGKVAGIENKNSMISTEFFKQISADAGAPIIGRLEVVGGSGVSRKHLYDSIVSGLKYTMNDYSNSNIDKFIMQLDKVLDFEDKHPFDPAKAIPENQLDLSKIEQVSRKKKEGLVKLVNYLKNNRAEYEKKLEKSNRGLEIAKAVGGKTLLWSVSSSQQRYFYKNKQYANSFSDLDLVFKDVNGNIPSNNELQEREFKITFYNNSVSPYVVAEQNEGKYTLAKLYNKEEYACIPSKGYEFICSSSLFKNGYKRSIKELKTSN